MLYAYPPVGEIELMTHKRKGIMHKKDRQKLPVFDSG